MDIYIITFLKTENYVKKHYFITLNLSLKVIEVIICENMRHLTIQRLISSNLITKFL